MIKLGVSLAMIAAAAGCVPGASADTKVSVAGVRYQFPAAHVISSTQDPHLFVRIRPPGESFELIYDSRSASQVDASGWPVIFSLNHSQVPSIYRSLQERVRVVCRQAPSPIGGCGIRVEHRGAQWSVLFSTSEAQTAAILHDRALAVLATYVSQA
jgi:hypothetical protein